MGCPTDCPKVFQPTPGNVTQVEMGLLTSGRTKPVMIFLVKSRCSFPTARLNGYLTFLKKMFAYFVEKAE